MIDCKEITYFAGDTRFVGFLASDHQKNYSKPGVLLAHDWSGRGEDICEKARKIAAEGYVGFAIDMYGDAKTGKTKKERQSLMYPLRDNRTIIAERMLAAYHVLMQQPQVDTQKIAALGYCFGGLCVLDLARIGAKLRGVVSFHGLLTAPEPDPNATIHANILILHGYDDPLVPPEQIRQFSQEMTKKNADWQMHMYGLTKHSFTNPMANDATMGLHYDPRADKRSWQSTLDFLKEIFA